MMRPWLARLAFLVVFLAINIVPTLARAQSRGAVHVVNLDSDDATEDHADALTAALKSRVRTTPGWQVSEANDSLSMLVPALKCPAKPDAACLQRIGDQLKTDRFFWGSVSKGTTPHQVTAEVHLWMRSKPEQSVKESYSDNLKDQNDEALRKIAGHIFERLTGSTTEGSLTIHSSVETAQVWVDGQAKGSLAHGTSTLTLSAGSHNIELRAEGYTSTGQTVSIVTGGESSLTIEPIKGAVVVPPTTDKPVGKPAPVMKIVGFTALGFGLVAGAVGAIEAVRFLNLQSQNNDDHANPSLKGVSDFCNPPSNVNAELASQACTRKTSAESARTLEYVFIGVGGALFIAGAVVLATDHSGSNAAQSSEKKASWHVVPSAAPGGGGVSIAGAF